MKSNMQNNKMDHSRWQPNAQKIKITLGNPKDFPSLGQESFEDKKSEAKRDIKIDSEHVKVETQHFVSRVKPVATSKKNNQTAK